MIARVWTGAVRTADAEVYADYVRATGFAEYGIGLSGHRRRLGRATDEVDVRPAGFVPALGGLPKHVRAGVDADEQTSGPMLSIIGAKHRRVPQPTSTTVSPGRSSRQSTVRRRSDWATRVSASYTSASSLRSIAATLSTASFESSATREQYGSSP
jgi:hypothetical protein